MDESKSFYQYRVIGSPMLRDFITISKLTVLETQIEKGNAAIRVWNGNILLIKDLITTDSFRKKKVWRDITEEHYNSAPSVIVGRFNF